MIYILVACWNLLSTHNVGFVRASLPACMLAPCRPPAAEASTGADLSCVKGKRRAGWLDSPAVVLASRLIEALYCTQVTSPPTLSRSTVLCCRS